MNTRVLVSIVYPYTIAIEAAKSVQKQSNWCENAEVAKLQFSSKWLRSFLTRAEMTRRKSATEDNLSPLMRR